jgi:NDP-sugar pyrophosphorylase family protein
MILAAGYGTRLRPITYTLPKPMVPLCNRPLIGWLVESLQRSGIQEIIVNLHHLPEATQRYLPAAFPDVHFDFSFEPEILGTGGGVRKVRHLLEGEEDFFLVNGDTLQFPPLQDLRRLRQQHDAIAALTLRHPPAGDRFTAVWHQNGLITGFGDGRGEPLMFSGTHCISSRIFHHFPDRDFFGIVENVYQPLLGGGEKVAGLVDDNPRWFDIGTPRRYLAAARELCQGNVIGSRSVVEGEARDSVVWDDCTIGRGVALESCIVAHGVEMRAPAQFRHSVICRDDAAIPRDPSYQFENGLVIACI